MINWVGKTILSQYGLICEVLEQNADNVLKCLSRHNGKVWEWPSDTVSLITSKGEVVDVENAEVFAYVDPSGHWQLYPEAECRFFTHEEMRRELGDY